MKKLKIWIIKIGEKPDIEAKSPIRNYMLANELAKRGHFVTYFLSGFDHYLKKETIPDNSEIKINENLKLKTINGFGYKKNISIRRYIDHKIIAKKFLGVAKKEEKPDVILASMPSYDLAYEAAKYAKLNNVPIIIDIRDIWPDFFLSILPKGLRYFAKLMILLGNNKLKFSLKKSSGIVSINEDMLFWALRKINLKKRNCDKVFYLGSPAVGAGNISRNKEFTVIYIGSFGSNSDPKILIQVAKKLPDVKFILIGSGGLFENIKSISKDLKNVELAGWLEKSSIDKYLQKAHVGLLPTSIESSGDFPNKTFTYLAAGIPLISSYVGELAKEIEKEGFGLNYKYNDPNSLLEKIRVIKNNPTLYKEMSIKARSVFREKFDSKKIYEDFADYIENIYSHNSGVN